MISHGSALIDALVADMVGYHYTPREHFEAIRASGKMIPSPLAEHIVNAMLSEGCKDSNATCVFENRQCGEALLGMLYRTWVVHGSTQVVELEIRFPFRWQCQNPGGEALQLKHDGSLFERERFIRCYHTSERVHLVKEPIPTERIRVVARYDLSQAMTPVEYWEGED